MQLSEANYFFINPQGDLRAQMNEDDPPRGYRQITKREYDKQLREHQASHADAMKQLREAADRDAHERRVKLGARLGITATELKELGF